jgi:hypothetical protein
LDTGPTFYRPIASVESTQLPRLNAQRRDPQCEYVDCLHMPDVKGRRETNYCNPPLSALPALATKLK